VVIEEVAEDRVPETVAVVADQEDNTPNS